MNYFNAKIKFVTSNDNGEVKTKTQEYLIEAYTFTDAETRLAEHLDFEYDLTALSIKKFDEIHEIELENVELDYFFKVVITHTTIDEDKGKGVKTNSASLVQADTTEDAQAKIKDLWKSSGSDWEIKSISQTNYIEII